jgi:hypothetical protein
MLNRVANDNDNSNRPSRMVGAALLSLAVLIMVAIAAAVYWSNPLGATDKAKWHPCEQSSFYQLELRAALKHARCSLKTGTLGSVPRYLL